MKKITVPVIAASLIMNAGWALAWSDVTGTIDRINTKSHEVVLSDGKTYELEKGVSTKNFKHGDKVKLSYENQKGKNVVNKMTKG